MKLASSCKHYVKLASNIMLMSRRSLTTSDCYDVVTAWKMASKRTVPWDAGEVETLVQEYKPFLNPLPAFTSQSTSTTSSNNNQCGSGR